MIEKSCAYFKSPIGFVEVIASESSLLSVAFVEKEGKSIGSSAVLTEAVKQLKEYFEGGRRDFDLPLQLDGTDFQVRSWKQLMNIPYGQTITYKELAKRVGNEKAVRAVGGANNRNKLPIVIPCHRVIGSNGKLVGFAGGLDKKEWLLEFEKNNI
ncbi:MAG: methylated-DNA--[protein]-cysteine S-methyltransferase [Bacillota bacterium]